MSMPFTGKTIDLIGVCLGLFAAAWLGRSAYLRALGDERLSRAAIAAGIGLFFAPLLFLALLIAAWMLVSQ